MRKIFKFVLVMLALNSTAVYAAESVKQEQQMTVVTATKIGLPVGEAVTPHLVALYTGNQEHFRHLKNPRGFVNAFFVLNKIPPVEANDSYVAQEGRTYFLPPDTATHERYLASFGRKAEGNTPVAAVTPTSKKAEPAVHAASPPPKKREVVVLPRVSFSRNSYQ